MLCCGRWRAGLDGGSSASRAAEPSTAAESARSDDRRSEAPAECGNVQTAVCNLAHPRSDAQHGSVMTYQEDTAAMRGCITSRESEPDAWMHAYASNDNAPRG